MKIISFILALAILVLSCIPCSDAENLAPEHYSLQLSSNLASGHSEKDHQEHHDICSPFCQCSCCALACTIPDLTGVPAEFQLPFTAIKFAVYMQQSPAGIAFPVWQPPKFNV